MGTMTTHNMKIYYVILNTTKYGMESSESEVLTEFLSSTAKKFDFTSRLGNFSLMRTTHDDLYGFRLYSANHIPSAPGAETALAAANVQLTDLDTHSAEATWHVTPFWA